MSQKEPVYKIKLSGEVAISEKEISEEIALKVITLIMGGAVKSDDSGFNTNSAITTEAPLEVTATPKAFMAHKKPSSEIERITCLAYYLNKYRNTSAFKTKDLTKLNTEAAQPTFSNPTVFARNAEAAGYLAKAGGGSKQISNFGESLVEALPDREKVKIALEAKVKRKTHPKRAKKVSKK